MMDISNDGEEEDQNSIAKSLVASINASHHHNTLPKTKSRQTAAKSRQTASISQAPVTAEDSSDDNEPSMNKTPLTARALRAERNLSNITRRLRNLPITARHPLRHHLIRDSPDEADHGDSTPNESTNLDAGNPSAPKGHSSISPVYPKKIGSMENPIDVDSIASLFEPTATKEYVRTSFALLIPFMLNIYYRSKRSPYLFLLRLTLQ